MRFVETHVFTKQIVDLLPDDDYRTLQVALALRPEQGRVVPGGGGIRKVRWAPKGRGKRGGLRILYFWRREDRVIYMLFAFAKSAQSDLTPAQLRTLARIVREEFK